MADFETADMRRQILHAAGPRPVFLARRRRRAVADLGDHRPVGEAAVLARAFGDRIDDELCRHAAGDDHGAAGQEARPVDGAAPQHRAVPARRTFVRIQRFAHRGMDAVGADQNVAARGRAVRAGAVEEIGGDAGFVLAERAEPAAGMDARFAEPGARRPDGSRPASGRDGSRIAARRSRHRGRAARARSPGRSDWYRTARRCGSRRRRAVPAGPEPASSLIACGSVLMPTPSSRTGVGLLEHFAVDAARMQHQRGGQPADAAADDNDFHGAIVSGPSGRATAIAVIG